MLIMHPEHGRAFNQTPDWPCLNSLTSPFNRPEFTSTPMQVSLSAPHQANRVLSPKEFEAALSDYPFAVRQALRMVGYLELGQLEMHMPDGRHFNFDTGQSGPKASMIIHDLAFASQLAKGGDIGIAEAYLQGQWETPDLTAFLQLFCSNQSVM